MVAAETNEFAASNTFREMEMRKSTGMIQSGAGVVPNRETLAKNVQVEPDSSSPVEIPFWIRHQE